MNMFRAFMELDKLTEDFDIDPRELDAPERTCSEYHCSSCGLSGVFYDDEVEDGCCPRCHDHHGGFAKCDDDGPADPLDNEDVAYLRNKPKHAWSDDDWDKYLRYVRTATDTQAWRDQPSLEEDAFNWDDLSAPRQSNWVARGQSQQPQQQTATWHLNNTTPSTAPVAPAVQTQSQAPAVGNIVTIVYDVHAHKLRAKADDGVHGYANVAFPNNLRTHEGQQYRVGGLVWNGKNYRVTGSIVAI